MTVHRHKNEDYNWNLGFCIVLLFHVLPDYMLENKRKAREGFRCSRPGPNPATKANHFLFLTEQ